MRMARALRTMRCLTVVRDRLPHYKMAETEGNVFGIMQMNANAK
jgi:hypothetical protein